MPPKGEDIYSQRIKFHSSPLEITYDKRTVNAVVSMFKTPEEINLDYLQVIQFETFYLSAKCRKIGTY